MKTKIIELPPPAPGAGRILKIELSGVIDESVDFFKLIPEGAREIFVDCRAVSRINSGGVRSWVRYFESARRNHTRLHFAQVSTVLIELNELFSIIGGNEIDSAQVPLLCTHCHKVWTVTLSLTSGRSNPLKKIGRCSCPSCKTGLVADVDPGYLKFLESARISSQSYAFDPETTRSLSAA